MMPIDVARQAAADGGRAHDRSPETTLQITGRLADRSLVTAAISDLSSSVVDGELTLTGILTPPDPPVGPQQFAKTVSLSQLYVNSACSVLIVDLGQLSFDHIGSTVNVIPIELRSHPHADSGSASLLPAMFGWLAGLLDSDGPIEGISTLLNRIFTNLGLRH